MSVVKIISEEKFQEMKDDLVYIGSVWCNTSYQTEPYGMTQMAESAARKGVEKMLIILAEDTGAEFATMSAIERCLRIIEGRARLYCSQDRPMLSQELIKSLREELQEGSYERNLLEVYLNDFGSEKKEAFIVGLNALKPSAIRIRAITVLRGGWPVLV